MPLTRKQQILADVEVSDGVPVTLTANDAVLVFDPDISDDVAFLDRVPAGSTLSRENTPPGLTTRQNTFQSDLVGSAVAGTAPPFGKFLKAAGYQEITLTEIPLTLASGAFWPGEIVTDSTNRAICLTHSSGATVSVWVMPFVGTITTGTLTGESSGSTGTIGTVSTTNEGFAYTTDSLRLIQFTTTGVWATSVGSTAVIIRSGEVVGAIQTILNPSGNVWDCVLLWGDIESGDTVDDGTNTETLSTAATQTRTPSLTIWNNKDGFKRVTAGARGDYACAAEGGAPFIFSWTFTGQASSHTDETPVATSGLGSTRAPRLGFSSTVGIGLAGAGMEDGFYKMPIKSVEIAGANVVGNRIDGNAQGGSIGTVITDRDPTITIEVEQTGTSFDWLAHRDAEQNVSIGIVLGTATMERVGIVANNCQIAEVAESDSDGFATFTVTLRPRRILEAGDDELIFFNY